MDIQNFRNRSRLSLAQQDKVLAEIKVKPNNITGVSERTGLTLSQVRTAFKHLDFSSYVVLKTDMWESYREAVEGLCAEGRTMRYMANLLSIPEATMSKMVKHFGFKIAKPHGTVTMYRSGCRCDPCKITEAARQRQERENRLRRKEEAPHGTESGYVNWGCRCEPCKEAGKMYNQRALSLPEGVIPKNKSKRWEEPEVDVLRDYAKPAKVKAVELGRTVGGVNSRRKMRNIKKTSTERVRL